jgi:hypothetical protein
MNAGGVFRIHIILHFMAADAELFGIGGFEHRIEPSPKDNPSDKPKR